MVLLVVLATNLSNIFDVICLKYNNQVNFKVNFIPSSKPLIKNVNAQTE